MNATENLPETVERLLATTDQANAAEVIRVRELCAGHAAANLSGYYWAPPVAADGPHVSETRARFWADLYRRCQEWLDRYNNDDDQRPL